MRPTIPDELAGNSEIPSTKGIAGMSGGCAGKVIALTRGGLHGRQGNPRAGESAEVVPEGTMALQKSAEAIVGIRKVRQNFRYATGV